ncbi:DNA-binding transcriptional response regulator, NtrC family, contains REC, AAA-type ATPase, and a Fis-type DNA-binding domains [Sphingomonas sp. NFR04]|uniref:sigma-54-dependent transcriptional regulator n=1 Tax=Sphingomonas sp. NFR04 TaxID=1566283 RepID=UPI0008EC7029|nr:response regulator [Sphingomonas sp. NFR04]SFJ07435.1 DNA-binding transcriptional response regulator, NtrC family, contains REC, AAA-type ATPase, and a Fis-type DNA-binding domains [Sphingomonas sp. NFR04]
MPTESPTILVIDDDPDIVRAATLLLERSGMRVLGAPDPDAAWVRLAEGQVDAILLDLNFARGRTSGEEGFRMLDRLVAADRNAIVVVVTGHSGIAVAVQAMRGGASDFVIKPWSNERLLATVQRALALRRAKLAAAPAPTGEEALLLLGEAPAIEAARGLIARVGPTDAAVLLTGPAGSGKTLAAQMLHRASARAERPLVTLDAAVADLAMIEARVVAAAGATLLIEAVDQLAPTLQPELARRLGGLRVLATSRRDRAGTRAALSDDLRFRLNTVEIDLPPLAERGGDALLLARHFCALYAGRHAQPLRPLTDEAARAIAADSWPDGVHGLRQAIERAVLLGGGEAIDVPALGLSLPEDTLEPRAIKADLNLGRTEAALVSAALKRHAFNVSRAAAELGLTRAALYRRMAKYGL